MRQIFNDISQWTQLNRVMQMMKLAMVAAGILSQSTPAMAQAAGRWDAVVAAALKEGRVTVYSAASAPIMDRLKADFEKAVPGIIVESQPGTSGALAAKLEAERSLAADGADMAIISELVWLDLKAKEGALRAPVGPSAAGWPAAYMRGNGSYPVLALEPLIITYNTSLVKTPITGYQDLLRPELKGRFGTNTMAATTVIAWLEWMEKSFGADFIARFAAQEPRLYAGVMQSTQAAAAGEIAATAYSTPQIALTAAERGAPVKIVHPNPSFGVRLGGGIVGWAKRPNAAQVFMNYVMSVRGQTAWIGPLGGTASPLPNIPNTVDARTINPYDPEQFPPEIVKTLTAKWNKIFGSK